MSNPVATNEPLEGVKERLESAADKLPLPGPDKYKIVWLLVVIGGGALLLLYLIHRNAQPVTATQPAQPAQDILDATSTATTPVATTPSSPSTPSKPSNPIVAIIPGLGKVNSGKPVSSKPAPPRKPIPTKPVSKPATDYTVHSGDTLAAIAAREHTTVSAIYSANRATIDNTARQHGHATNTIDWIYPGEMLAIP